MKITEMYYDSLNNKTHAYVETDQFSEWLFVAGRATKAQFEAWVTPSVIRIVAELGSVGQHGPSVR